jgi:predicted DNA-binding transcriptional regulator AlpA
MPYGFIKRSRPTILEAAMTDTTDTLLTPEEVAQRLRSTENYLAQLRFRGRGPKFIRHDRLIRYRESDVDAWLESGVTGDPRKAAAR